MIPTQAEIDEKFRSMKELIDFLDLRLRDKEDERLSLELEYNKMKSKLDNTIMDNAFLEKKLKEKIRENTILKEIIMDVKATDHNIQDKKILDALNNVSDKKLSSDRGSPLTESRLHKKLALDRADSSLENLLANYEKAPIIKKKVTSMIDQVRSKCSQSMEIMKVKLAKEKQRAIKLQSKDPLREREKSELESLFLECIEEQKKQVEKRKMISRLSAQKAWKKEITPSDEELKLRMHGMITGKLDCSELPATDKLLIFEKFILQPSVLTIIYNKMFEDNARKVGNSLIHPIA
jgi:hypothetical protein